MKSSKSVGLSNKSDGFIVGAFVENQIVKENTKSVLKTFKNLYSNLAGNALGKLPRLPIGVVSDYKKGCSTSTRKTGLNNVRLLTLLKNFEVTKVAVIDQISGKVLKILSPNFARPISELCSLSRIFESFPVACKIRKVKSPFQKGSNMDPSNYRPVALLLL